MNSSGIIMLLIIAGIGFIWYLLYEDRERTAKENEGKGEFDVLLENTDFPEDECLDRDKSSVSREECTNEILMAPDEVIDTNNNVVEKEIETPHPTPKNKKNKKSRKSNKK